MLCSRKRGSAAITCMHIPTCTCAGVPGRGRACARVGVRTHPGFAFVCGEPVQTAPSETTESQNYEISPKLSAEILKCQQKSSGACICMVARMTRPRASASTHTTHVPVSLVKPITVISSWACLAR